MLTRLLPRFQKAYKSLPPLAEREQWSRAEIEAFQLARLNEVWRHAIAHVPYYRHLQAAQRLPERWPSLDVFQAEMPVLAKSSVKEDRDAFLSERPDKGGWKRTGGSTGTPMDVYWSDAAHQEMLRTKYRFYQQWGIDIFDPAAYLWGHSASFVPGLAGRIARWRQPIEDRLRNRLRLSAYNLSHHDLRDYLEQIAAFRPVSLYSYTRAMALLAQEAEAGGFRCESLKLVVLTGEPAFPHLVEKIERAFGIPAVVEYGAIDCGAIAGEWPDRTLRVREDVSLVETLPREDGRYEIVVTVLNNPSFPLLRYAIGDVTDAPLEQPERGFAILKNVSGRDNDFVLTRTGRYLHPARFDAFFKYETANLKRFRVNQRRDGSVRVQLELDDPRRSVDLVVLTQRLRDMVEGYPVKVDVVESIPQTPAGKHRLVTSELANEPAAGVIPQHPITESHRHNGTNGSHGPAHPTLVEAPREQSTGDVVRLHRAEKCTLLRRLIESPDLSFLMEAHNGLSARIVEEAGFEAIWASGLSISAALGVRDSNEASWTQVLEVLEFMSDATRIPILVDGDTGYGNFNNMRRLVRKLEQRRIGGVCIEDKLFPKANSFIDGTKQPLATMDEFRGKIKAGKDAQQHDDFVIVARIEALIAGWGMDEALRRAEAYHHAGADAILIHSAKRTPEEILRFKQEWGDRSPVVIVPTKYYATPTDVFRDYHFSAVIWANHLMRSCITAMQRTAQEIFEDQTLINVEDRVAPLAEVFRLQGAPELAEAERRYLPAGAAQTRAIILAASRGSELGEMTEERPKCMVPVGGEPILSQIVHSYRAAGVQNITVVRGYRKDAVDLDGLRYVDNDDAPTTGSAYSLYLARAALQGECLVSYGDVLFKKYLPQELMEIDAVFVIAVDANWKESRNRNADFVTCTESSVRKAFYQPARLLRAASNLTGPEIHGLWMGFLKCSAAGSQHLQRLLEGQAATNLEELKSKSMVALLNDLVADGHEIRVLYSSGHWLDIDSVEDVLAGSNFR